MIISTLTESVERGISSVTQGVNEALFEPVIRLGVTGLARSGKTVFITSLVANLIDRGRMPQLRAAANGAISAAYLRPQPDDTVPRFAFEDHLMKLTGSEPVWPESTRAISELRISLRVQPQGMLGALSGPRTVHLDIVDYPGEWLLDLGLLDKGFAEWSAAMLAKLPGRPGGEDFLNAVSGLDATAKLDEVQAQGLARAYTAALQGARNAGYSDCAPGRFLLPGELEGSPVLTFCPLPPSESPRGSLAREFARRFEAYKAQVAKPFFREHFAKIDRQVVLVDALSAIHAGPQAVEDLRTTLQETLAAFKPGRNGWLSPILGKRVEKILFAATKADHLHHSQHGRFSAIMDALVKDARNRADFAGAETGAMAIASLRATVEETRSHEGRTLDCVRGTLLSSGKEAALFAGELPDDPAKLLNPGREGADSWLDADYNVMQFAPARLTLKPDEGPPHIRLDRATEFLIGDRLT